MNLVTCSLGDRRCFAKTSAALLLGLSSTLLINIPAGAESFNNRDKDYLATSQVVSQIARKGVTAIDSGFGSRGEHFIETVPAGSPLYRKVVTAIDSGFGSRGEQFIETIPTGSQVPRKPVVATPNSFNDRGILQRGQ